MAILKYKNNILRLMVLKKKFKRGYSIVEVLVSLGIMTIVITMLFNVLILGLQSSIKSIARSSVREELSNISGLISRDFRNSENIVNCAETTEQEFECTFFKNNVRYSWRRCNDDITKVCKYELGNVQSEIYRSSDNLNFETFEFHYGFGNQDNENGVNNILLTLVVSHTNSYININNVFRQTYISTRNYRY
jgi:type II secretory pathway pseudopilin PulG